MAVLTGLQPRRVFEIFEEISAIPHGSGNTQAISDYCAAFAGRLGLPCRQDQAGNVVIVREAAPGYESAGTVILQGHLDMVCEKTAGCLKDMAAEGLELSVDGDLVSARGTTLGADDGVAVAMALAVLEDATLPHPRLEAVLTTGEEVGMTGAAAMDMPVLRGRRLINIDSEAEGVFTAGCAGGVLARCRLPVRRRVWEGSVLSVTVGDLAGGHSGAEIHRGRGNACVLLGRALDAVRQSCQMRLISAAGGLKVNAIPRASSALIAVDSTESARSAVRALDSVLKREFCDADPNVFVRTEPAETAEAPMDEDSTARAVCLLLCGPNGVQTMSTSLPGQVRTSLNLGILQTAADTLTADYCIRSSLSSEKEWVKCRLACLLEQLGGTAAFSGDYPGWEYRPVSPLRQLMTEVYREQAGKEPKIEVIHMGVECGFFCDRLPGMDCVSIGPDIRDIHTPREAMSISSVQRVWSFLLEVLKRCR